MTGKDLFSALNHVDDVLVAEAETYTARRVIPMPAIRWMGALAACFCLLIGWAVLAQTGGLGFGKSASVETAPRDEKMEWTENTAEVETDGAVPESAPEEECEVTMEESEAAGMENGSIHDTAGGAQPTETPASSDYDRYLIFAEAPPDAKSDGTVLYAAPLNGAVILGEDISNTMDMLVLAHTAKPARFLVAFDLYRDEEKLHPDSDEYLAEVERLKALGYDFRTLNVQHTDKSVQVRICCLCDEGQLRQFAASADYGYLIRFPENEDGTPLNWEDKAGLCGLPTAEGTK